MSSAGIWRRANATKLGTIKASSKCPITGTGKLAEVDLKTGKVIAQTDVAERIDQIAFDPTHKRIYCASGSGVLSVVQETTDGMKNLGEAATARGCHSVTVDPTTGAVWVAYGDKTGGSIMKLVPTD